MSGQGVDARQEERVARTLERIAVERLANRYAPEVAPCDVEKIKAKTTRMPPPEPVGDTTVIS